MNAEWAEADESKYGQSPEREGKHGQSAFQKTTSGKREYLHGLGESARQKESRYAHNKWRKSVIKFGSAQRVFGNKFGHGWLEFFSPMKNIQ